MWPAKIWGLHSFDAGRDWGQEEKGMTEDEIAGWHHWLDGCESEWTPGVGDGQGGLACWDSWGHKESDMTERLNWTELVAQIGNRLPAMWETRSYHTMHQLPSLVFIQIRWKFVSTQKSSNRSFSSFIHNSQNSEVAKLSFGRWMNK